MVDARLINVDGDRRLRRSEMASVLRRCGTGGVCSISNEPVTAQIISERASACTEAGGGGGRGLCSAACPQQFHIAPVFLDSPVIDDHVIGLSPHLDGGGHEDGSSR